MTRTRENGPTPPPCDRLDGPLCLDLLCPEMAAHPWSCVSSQGFPVRSSQRSFCRLLSGMKALGASASIVSSSCRKLFAPVYAASHLFFPFGYSHRNCWHRFRCVEQIHAGGAVELVRELSQYGTGQPVVAMPPAPLFGDGLDGDGDRPPSFLTGLNVVFPFQFRLSLPDGADDWSPGICRIRTSHKSARC